MRVALVTTSGLLVALVGGTAAAAGRDPAAAEALFREGRRAADAGNYPVACARFEESERLDPAPGTLLNLADCEENRGQLARAWEHFRQLYDQVQPSDERHKIAEDRIRALEPRLPTLRVVLDSSVPATVTRDDVGMGVASLGTNLPVDPGAHTLVVSSPGRKDRKYSIALVERQAMDVSVSPGEPMPGDEQARLPLFSPVEPAPAAPPPAAQPISAEPPPSHTRGTVALVLGSVGAASLAVGGTFGVIALSELGASNGKCTGNTCANQQAVSQYHSAQSFAAVADVSLGVGIACVGTAIVLALSGPHTSDVTTTGITSWSPLSVGGRF